jgi:hypothetical protein
MVALTRAKKRIASTSSDVRDRVTPAAGSALDALEAALGEAKDRVAPAIDDAKGRLGPALDDAKGRLGPALDDAKGRIRPAFDDARVKIGPALEDARDRIGPALEDARGKLVPVAQQALAGGRRRGRQAAVKLNIVEEPEKGHKLRNLLVVLGLSGAGLFVYKKFFNRHDDWSDADVGASTRPSTDAAPAARPSTNAAPTGNPSHSNGKNAASDGRGTTAPTAPLASEETVASLEPTTPDAPLEEKKVEHD